MVAVCVAIVVLGACGGSAPPTAVDEPGIEPVSVTRWTEHTELFAEYPPLVVGETSRFAVHLTRLDPFQAVIDGEVEVQLRGRPGEPETFRVDGPSSPGIFGVDVLPSTPGRSELVIILRSRTLSDEHVVGAVEVFPDTERARAAVPPDGVQAEGISFLKEQQWTLDFGTGLVQQREVRRSLRVSAEIVPRPGAAAEVVAPIDGRLISVSDLAPGASVVRGEELGRLLPAPAAPGEVPQLEQLRAEAEADLELARHDRERAERLVEAGAAPRKRLEEARVTETQAATRVRGADARLEQHTAARGAESTADPERLFVLRTPISGGVASRHATTGANVTAGSVLFSVVDVSAVHIVGRIPAASAHEAARVVSAEMEVPGGGLRRPVGQPVSVGTVIDPQARTLAITFAWDNTVERLPVGQSVFLNLMMGVQAPAPVVPMSSVVDDAGRPIVFVQVEGETFERRPVTLGEREGEFVQVTAGLTNGERVVTRGAYLIRLASLSTQVPAHGHVH
jgi:RND family efflux transporter MFP subunit